MVTIQPGPRWYERPPVVCTGGLLILGLGAAAVELLGQSEPAKYYVIASGVFALGAAGCTVAGRMFMSPDQPRSEAALDTFMVMVVFGAAFAADVLAVLNAQNHPTTSWLIVGGLALWLLVWLPARFRSITVTTRMFFARDVHDVFEYLSDFRTQTEYGLNVVSVEKLDGGPVGLGSRFLTQIDTPNGLFTAVDRIVEYRKDMLYASVIEGALRPAAGVATFQRVVGGTDASFRFTSRLSYASAVLGQGIFRAATVHRLKALRLAAWSRAKLVLESPQPVATYDGDDE